MPSDQALIISNDADPTKQLRFDLTALGTGKQVIASFPNPASGGPYNIPVTMPLLEQTQTWTESNTFNQQITAIIGLLAGSPGNAGTLGVHTGSAGANDFVGLTSLASTLRSQVLQDASGTLALLEAAQTFTTTQTIQPATDVVALKLKANATGAVNLLEGYDNSGALMLAVPETGVLYVNGLTFYPSTPVGTGNGVSFAAATLTGSRTATFPDATGTVCLLTATQTLTNKTISRLQTATTVKGTPVIAGDNTGATTANLMSKLALTAQAAAIAATNITDTCPAGLYRVTYYLETTTAQVGDGTIAFKIAYTDRVGATTQTTAATLSLAATTTGTTALSGSFVFYMASGNCQYSTVLTGAQTNSRYSVDARCEYLG
jgi:hypothetical protein